MATTTDLIGLARKLGGHSADAYRDAHGARPRRGTPAEGRAESDWEVAKRELWDHGMDDRHEDECMESWRSGFFGD